MYRMHAQDLLVELTQTIISYLCTDIISCTCTRLLACNNWRAIVKFRRGPRQYFSALCMKNFDDILRNIAIGLISFGDN